MIFTLPVRASVCAGMPAFLSFLIDVVCQLSSISEPAVFVCVPLGYLKLSLF